MIQSDRPPRVALLPLYLELYDQALPEMRAVLEPFLAQVAAGLEGRGLEVKTQRICRLKSEFEQAVAQAESEDVDLLVTLHLAYSPSLESADALVHTSLPLLILDTTLDHDFGPATPPERLLYNHGIHGVMDLANVLRRQGKPFRIVAGHWKDSDVLRRVADAAYAAYGARTIRERRTLRLGPAFEGMGDFSVHPARLQRQLDIAFDAIMPTDLKADVEAVTDVAVEAEMNRDRELYRCDLPEDVHARSVKISLGLRALLERGGYGAMTMNFGAFDSPEDPISTPPFLEASKAMARGVGYAGEGDVLTAAFVGGLIRAFGRVTFTEIFCPDWQGDSLFLSHMGEINPAVAADRPWLLEKPFPFSPARNPAILTCAPAPGPAIFADLAPGPDDKFALIAAPVEVLEDTRPDLWREAVRGWIRPAVGVAPFLEAYSRLGGTHHSALVSGVSLEAIEAFAQYLGVSFETIGA